MRITRLLGRKILPQLGLALCLFLHYSCASDGEAQNDEDGLESQDGENAGKGDEALLNQENASSEDELADQAKAPPPPPPAPVQTVAQPPAGVPVPPPGDASKRVVRYVMPERSTVYGGQDANSASVGTMYQGDMIMVLPLGDWAQLTEGRFMRASELSETAVARSHPQATWAYQPAGGAAPMPAVQAPAPMPTAAVSAAAPVPMPAATPVTPPAPAAPAAPAPLGLGPQGGP